MLAPPTNNHASWGPPRTDNVTVKIRVTQEIFISYTLVFIDWTDEALCCANFTSSQTSDVTLMTES